MPTAAERLSRFENALKAVTLDRTWAENHHIEFDLRGELNPSVMVDDLWKASGEVTGFDEFSEQYVQRHFQRVKALYGELIALKQRGETEQLIGRMSQFAFEQYQHDLIPGLSDAQITQGLRARLYRTLAGIYTELHAYLMCAQALGEARVKRSLALDRSGVDFQITLNAKTANVHVIRDSAKARAALTHKLRRKGGSKLSGLHVILPYGIHGALPESTRNLGNGFYVFRDAYLKSFIVAVQCYEGQEQIVVYQPARLTTF